MSIPVSEAIVSDMVYINKDSGDRLILKNDTGADLAKGDFAVLGGKFSVVALEAVANAASGDFDNRAGLIIQTKNLKTSEDTFGTDKQKVFWDPTNKKFSDTDTLGYYWVGNLVEVKTGGVITIKLRHAPAIGTEMTVVQIPITADATTAQSKSVPNGKIVNAWVVADATNASGTLRVQTSAGANITNAITCATDNALTNCTSIDSDNDDITDNIVKIIANGAADRGRVYLMIARS